MTLFGKLFSKTKPRTAALIEVGPDSVAGAYLCCVENGVPTLAYARRISIENRGDEERESAMLRSLSTLGELLIREGAPALARTAGSGHVDTILVSIDAPWQETSVRTEQIERKDPFVFTRSMVTSLLERTRVRPKGKHLGNESVIGMMLNGYETARGYGKRAHRASVLILTSLIDEQVAKSIVSTLEQLYHTKHILHIAKCSLRYQAMRILFPHELNALILDVSTVAISIVLVRRGYFRAVTEVSRETPGTGWVPAVVNEFSELAKHYPLPRTIFVLAPEAESAATRVSLETAHLGSLWLSDNPPKIISVVPSHLSSLVNRASDASPDLALLLMALYAQHSAIE